MNLQNLHGMCSKAALAAARGGGVAVVIGATLLLGACADLETSGLNTSFLGQPATSQIETGATDAGDSAGRERKLRDPASAMATARQLKAAGDSAKALETLQNAAILNPRNTELLGELGRTALAQGQFDLADQALQGADFEGQKDWRVISARGTLAAKRGQFADSIPFFERAYRLAPNEPTVLNNLGLAYAANGDAAKALPLVKLAAERGGDERIQRNLEIVAALQVGAPGAPEPAAWSTTILDVPEPAAAAPAAWAPRAKSATAIPMPPSGLRLQTGSN